MPLPIKPSKKIKRPSRCDLFLALAVLCVWCLYFCPTAWAADPLPPDIEAAAPDVQARYIERMGRESLEEKLKLGRLRHEDRVATRKAIYRQMEAEVANRMAEVTGTNSITSRSPIISFLKPTAIVVGCAIAMILVIQAWRRTAMQ